MLQRLSRFWVVVAAMGLIVAVAATVPLASSAADRSSSSGSTIGRQFNPCFEDYRKLTIVVNTQQENVAEGDRLWDSHHRYMRRSHKEFLITYSLTSGPELANPLDPGSAPTGRTTYVLNECYKTSADILRHWEKTDAEWQDFDEIIAWMQLPGTQVVTLHDGLVRNSLW